MTTPNAPTLDRTCPWPRPSNASAKPRPGITGENAEPAMGPAGDSTGAAPGLPMWLAQSLVKVAGLPPAEVVQLSEPGGSAPVERVHQHTPLTHRLSCPGHGRVETGMYLLGLIGPSWKVLKELCPRYLTVRLRRG